MAVEVNDDLAILNLQRRVIEGPQLLDQLVNVAADSHVAIHYLGKDGHRSDLSYVDLETLSNTIAQQMNEQLCGSTQRNTIIPVVLPQHPALYVSYLAILKCGAAFCPVLPDTPPERLKFILKDIDATVGICWSWWQDTLSLLSPQTRWIAIDWQKSLRLQRLPQQLTVGNMASRNTSDIAYVMYTSGSTGQPKGVSISHHAVTQSLLAHDEHIPYFERFLQFAAPTFDVSVFEIFFPLFRGSTLVCCERDLMLTDLPGIIERCEIDACELTPTVARTLLRSRALVPSLKALLTIGEMLNTQTVEEFGGNENQESILFAMYGPTEATIHCTIAPRMTSESSVRDIGKPLSTVTSFILSDAGAVAKKGQIGELAIAGQLAEGYLNRHEATSTSFVDLLGYGQVYKTGDRAMITAADELLIYGRISSGQVKIRGQRVELGEIEQAACRNDKVELAVALVIQDSLILFCSGGSELSSRDVADACKSWLPRHMLPTDVVILQGGLPRLASGKVDRALLESSYMERILVEAEEIIDRTTEDTYSHIFELISSELGVFVDAKTSLATNGLDSLRAIKISSKLRQRYPHASASIVLEAETIEQLICFLTEMQPGDDSPTDTNMYYEQLPQWVETVAESLSRLREIEPETTVEEVLPCSAIQIAMLAETSFDSMLNFNTIHVSLDGRYSFEQFRAAFSTLAKQTPILRCGFLPTQNPHAPYVQIIKSTAVFTKKPSILRPIWIRQSTDPSIVIFTIHHAVYDGWSWDIVVHELNRILSGSKVRSRPSYHEYVVREKAISVETICTQLTTWVDDLKDFEPVPFPVLRADIVEQPERAQYQSLMSLSLSAFSEYARANQVSNASIAHSALLLLLSQLLDTADVTTGLVLAGRDRALVDVEEVVGPCLTTLPLRMEMSKSVTAIDLVRRVHQQHLKALRFSAVSLAQIKSALNFQAALFDIIFVWQQSPYTVSADDHVHTESSKDNLNCSLLVEVEPVGDSIRLRSTYDTSKMDLKAARIFHKHLNAILSAMVQDTSHPVATIMSEMEHGLLAAVSAKLENSNSSDLTSTIVRLACEDPERIAVEFITEDGTTPQSYSQVSLTYKDLYNRSKLIANLLHSYYAVKRNEIVAIFCQKSIDTYTVICAIIQAGVAYLCIDTGTPMKRVAEIVKQANAKVLLADTLEPFKESQVPVATVTMSEFCNQSTQESWNYRNFRPSPTDLTYTVFTSGSTGIPKGVLIERQNVISNIQALAAIFPYRSSSKLLQSCSLAFDVSVFEIFWTWHCGLTLCATSNDVLYQDIENFIRINNITHLSMTPSVAALVDPGNVPNVEFIVCSGEPMSRKVFETWTDHGLHQGYGPSETTNICNVRQYREGRSYINNVGPAFSNTSLYVCKRRLQARANLPLDSSDFVLLPIGAVGEIWIGGAQVGRGYTDDTLTSRSWLEHPELGKLYRSGDIGRLLADDSLVIIGRDDDQTKIRGLRIELNEINSKLIATCLVRDCYTLILKDEGQSERLVCFWVTGPDTQSCDLVIKTLYERLLDALPSYMVPELLVPVSALPTTRQGKIDKARLRLVYESLARADRERFSNFIPSTEIHENPTEAYVTIRSVLSQLTDTPVAELNDHASFFTYGIDSLRAIPFVQRLQKSGVCHVTISEVLRHASVSRLAAYIETKKGPSNGHHGNRAEDILPLKLREEFQTRFRSRGKEVDRVLPCGPLQQAMLSSATCTDEDGYVSHVKYQLRQIRSRIKDAWTNVVQRHEMLRTVFALTDDQGHPIIQGVLSFFKLPWSEGSEPPSAITLRPFEAPPYRLHLEYQADGIQILHLFMHHALFDAEAINSIQLEIETFCLERQLPEPIPFSRYLDAIASIDAKSANHFWSRHLRNVRPARFVISKQARVKRHRVITRHSTCPITYSHVLAYARQSSITVLSLFQAILAQFLSRTLQQKDVCFGTVYSGRQGVDGVVGPCFNTLPTRVKLGDRSTLKETCKSLRDFNSAVLAFQGTALRDLQKLYSSDGQRLFDVILLFQPPPHRLNEKLWSLIGESGQMDFPLIVELKPDIASHRIEIFVHSSIISASILDVILADLLELLGVASNDPSITMGDNKLCDVGRESCLALSSMINQADLEISDKRTIQSALVNNKAKLAAREAVLTSLKALSRKNLKTVPMHYDIYRIGLDSIGAAQLAHRLTSSGYKVTASEILENPKVDDIVDLCTRSSPQSHIDTMVHDCGIMETFDQKHRESVLGRLKYATQDIEVIWPCTSTQLGILSEYARSDAKLYYNTIRLSLGETTKRKPLFRAWHHVASRHVMLRTAFLEVEDEKSPFAMVVYAATSPLCREENWFDVSIRENGGTSSSVLPTWSLQYIETEDSRFIEWKILHALYDAQSLETILSDVAACYHGTNLPPVGDIRCHLQDIHRGNQVPVPENALFMKLKEMALLTEFPDLNIRYQVPSRLCSRKSQLVIELSEIQASCEERSCTVSIACQAAWATILASYTGQRRVAFGNIMTTRLIDNIPDDVVFPCINTLPVVVDVDSDMSLIEQISHIHMAYYKNTNLSASRMQRFLAIEGDLFDTVFAFQQTKTQVEVCDLWYVTDEASAEYTVSLEAVADYDRLSLQLTYDQKRIPDEHARILLDQYEQILYEILGLRVNSTLPPQHYLSSFRPRCDFIPTELTGLHELFFASLAKTPQKIALEYVTGLEDTGIKKQTWSYAEVAERAAIVAQLIGASEVSPGCLIAICFDKCPEASIVLLGILMSGCAYVAIDPGAPPARQKFILEDARCPILITMSSTAPSFRILSDLSIIELDDLLQRPVQADPWRSLARISLASDVCYCLYTSGTTGTPKGCLISHRSAIQAMLSFSRIFRGRWNSDSRWLQFAAYHFDVSVLEHFWTWQEGLCVTVVPRDILFEDLPGTISRLDITHLDLTPSLARLLTPETVPSLGEGVFIVGGEQVGQDIIETWGDAQCLFNFYGPSEVTIGCTVHPQVARDVKATNIGYPWDNVGAYVLKPDDQKVTLIGGIGELCLSGPLIGIGYLNRMELTAKKFCTLENGDRIYRTGDLVRMLHDGSLDFLGRIDDQVKLRGQRLEIGEINSVLKRGSQIFVDAVALILAHPEQDKETIVGFLALKKASRTASAELFIRWDDNFHLAAQDVRRHAINNLPGYMVPTHLFAIDFVPLTPNNKVDRNALRDLYDSLTLQDVRKYQEVARQAESDSSELHRLKSIISRHLGLSDFGLGGDTSLIQLGVDSIAAIQLSRKLRSQGYKAASVANLMRYPVIGNLCEVISQHSSDQSPDQGKNVDAAKVAIDQFASKHHVHIEGSIALLSCEIEHISPCTALQQGMISHILGSDSSRPSYLTEWVYSLAPTINLAKLREAWIEAAYQLDILRTCFISTDDGYAQVVLKISDLPVQIDQGKSNSAEHDDTPFKNWVRSVRDLGPCLPWSVYLGSQSLGERQRMCLRIFHGLYDGVSLPLLLNCVENLYMGRESGMKDITSFYNCLAFGPLAFFTASDRQFWEKNLKHVKLLSMHQDSKLETLHSRLISRVIDISDVQSLSEELSVTAQAIFHAAWLIVLARKFEINPTIGIVFSGRLTDLEDADKVVGPLFNTLPVTIDVPAGNATFSNLVKSCHNKLADMLPHQHNSLSEIRKTVRIPGTEALFDSLFVYQIESAAPSKDTVPLWEEVASQSNVDLPLNFEVQPLGQGRYQLKIAARDFPEAVVDFMELLDDIEEILRAIPQPSTITLPSVFWDNSSSPISGISVTELRSEPSSEYQTAEAEAIREVLTSLLKEDVKIGDHSPNIFELGLDSLDAIKIAARLKTRGITLPVSRILRYPTVAEMTHQVLTDRHKLEQVQEPDEKNWYDALAEHGFKKEDFEMVSPVTNMQEGLLLDFEQYQNSLVYRLSDSVQFDQFRSAMLAVVTNTSVFRTKFLILNERIEGSSYIQAVTKPEATLKDEILSFHNLQNLDDLERYIKDLRKEVLSEHTASHISVVQLDDGEKYLVFRLTHALYDGWSIQLLLHYMEELYHGRQLSPANPEHVAGFITRTRKESTSESAKKFWSNLMQNIRPTILVNNKSSSRAIFRQSISKINAKSLRQKCQKIGVTMQSATLAAWHLVLVHLTKHYDVNFGLVLSGRDSEDAESLIFPTFNTVVFRACYLDEVTGEEFLRLIHQKLIEIYEFQHFSLSESLKIARVGQNTIFDSLFTFQKTPQLTKTKEALLTVVDFGRETFSPPYPVNIEAEEVGDTLVWTIATQPGAMNTEDVDDILHILDEVLGSVVIEAGRPIFEGPDEALKVCGLPPIHVSRISNELAPQPLATMNSDHKLETLSRHELLVRDVLAQISGVATNDISKHTSIFSLGLDSISAIRISKMLRERSLVVTVSAILKAQNLVNIAQSIKAAKEATSQKLPIFDTHLASKKSTKQILDRMMQAGLTNDSIDSILPASGGQVYMLDMWQASNQKLMYGTFWLKIHNCNARRFETGFNELIANTPILRTRFIWHDGRYFQVVLSPSHSGTGPFQYRCLQVESSVVFTLVIHHALYDAVSLNLMLSEMQHLYSAPLSRRLISTQANNFLQSTILDRNKAQHFWRRYLQDIEPVTIDGSFDSPRNSKFEPSVIDISIFKDVTRRAGVSVQAILFAAVAYVYAGLDSDHRFSSNVERQTVIGIYMGNRSLDVEGITELAAPTFNVVPLKVKLSGSRSLVDMAKEIQKDLQEIALAERCGWSLRDIYTWTGTKINCVVNFLRLPAADPAPTPLGVSRFEETTVIEHATGEAKEIAQSLIEVDRKSPFMQEMGARDFEWCMPTLDVEAKVDEHGQLAVGLFAPEDMADENKLQVMMDELRSLLVGI